MRRQGFILVEQVKSMKTRLLALSLAALLCAAGAAALAAPAHWFKWRSKADGKQFCSQTSLGPGWEKASGPFKDSRCEKPAAVK